MAARPSFKELSSCYATATYFDDQGVPFTPASVRYRLDDLSNEVSVLPWTVVPSPGLSTRLTITSQQNAMSANNSRKREIRRVTFEVTNVAGDVRYDNAEYDLIRSTTVP